MEPVFLRHKDARRQAALFSSFSVVTLAVMVFMLTRPTAARWWALMLLPLVAFLVYSAVRLFTLKVKLDGKGIWEPNPFKLDYVTPWSDVKRVQKSLQEGRVRFLSVEVVHADGDRHEIVALKVQATAAYAETMIEDWIDQIREAKKAAA